MKEMREDQRGRYYGVGMMIGPQGTHQVVIAPTPGAPAYKAGLRPGDVLMEVNDKKVRRLEHVGRGQHSARTARHQGDHQSGARGRGKADRV